MLTLSRKASAFAALALLASWAAVDPISARALCSAQPLAGCKQPTVADKALLLLKNLGGAADKLTFKWVKGEETLSSDLGDPVGTTVYTLCVYDSTGGTPSLVSQAIVPAGGMCDGKPCWAVTGAGFKFKDPTAANAGISKIILKAGEAGKAKLIVKGKGDLLDTPALPLAQDQQVIAQLSNDIGACWEARFSPPSIKNEGEQFKDKGDPPLAGPTATATATATNTPPGGASTPTATPTATTMGGGSCGNHVLEPGETCQTCPGDCTVLACTPVGPTIPFTMTLVPPPGQAPTGATVFLGYHSGRLSIPGSATQPSVLTAVTAPPPAPSTFIRNDQNYGLSVVLSRTTPIEVLFTVTFDQCQGAPAPTVADLGCSVLGCAAGGPPIDGCTCTVSQP